MDAYDVAVDDSPRGPDREGRPLDRLLTAAGQAAGRLRQRAASTHGLSTTALGVLGVLAEADAVSQRELAGRLDVTPATLTPVLDGLERAGSVLRSRDARDRRVIRLSITPAGRERWSAARAGVAAAVRERLPQPGPEDEAIIRGYLIAVLAGCDDEFTVT